MLCSCFFALTVDRLILILQFHSSVVLMQIDAKPLSTVQTQVSAQASQPAAVSPYAVLSSAGTPTQKQFHWYHAALGVGLLAASGCGTALLIKVSMNKYF